MSHQRFELAALQSTDEVMFRERFRLDELVTDAVQKFEFNVSSSPVALERPAPGTLELDGDLQLLERAPTNVIDHAVRRALLHDPRPQPRANVCVVVPDVRAVVGRAIEVNGKLMDAREQRP